MPSFFTSFAVPALALAGSAFANPLKRGDDACLAAVTGKAALGDDNIRKQHCSSFIKTIVTPAAITVTTTITDAPEPTGWENYKRAVTLCPNEVPNYASACDEPGYKSACSVWGVQGETTFTIPATTTTKTVYQGKGGDSTCSDGTATVTSTVTKADNTVTSTVTQANNTITTTVGKDTVTITLSGGSTVTGGPSGGRGPNGTVTTTITEGTATTTVTITSGSPTGRPGGPGNNTVTTTVTEGTVTTTATSTVTVTSGSSGSGNNTNTVTTTATVTVTSSGSGSGNNTVTSTVTKDAVTVTVSASAGPTGGLNGTVGSGNCISKSKADYFVTGFIDLLEYTSYPGDNTTGTPPGRGYHQNVSDAILDANFADYSDSINWMAGFPVSPRFCLYKDNEH